MNETFVLIALGTAAFLAFVLTRVNPHVGNSRRLALLIIFLVLGGAAVAIGLGLSRPQMTYASGVTEPRN